VVVVVTCLKNIYYAWAAATASPDSIIRDSILPIFQSYNNSIYLLTTWTFDGIYVSSRRVNSTIAFDLSRLRIVAYVRNPFLAKAMLCLYRHSNWNNIGPDKHHNLHKKVAQIGLVYAMLFPLFLFNHVSNL